MFAKGAAPGKVKTWSYDEDEEDFTKGDKSFHAAAPQLIMNSAQMPPPWISGYWTN